MEGSNASRLEARLRLRVAVKSRAGHGSLRNGARFVTEITTGCLVAASVLRQYSLVRVAAKIRALPRMNPAQCPAQRRRLISAR